MTKIEENIIEKQEQVEDNEAQEVVKENFACLGVEIEKDKNLFTRLVELQKMGHFGDAIKMSKIIDLLPIESKSCLKLCALLHDVGKTGPLGATPKERKFFSIIFHHKKFKTHNHSASIKEALDKESEAGTPIEEIRKIEKYLVSSLGMDIGRRLMIDLWHDHASHTYEILKNANLPQIDEEIIKIAASHHILDGRNPANLPLDRIPGDSRSSAIIDQYQILTLVDKYQARRSRSHCNHEEAIKNLKQIIEANEEVPENIKQQYLELIKLFNRGKEGLDKLFK